MNYADVRKQRWGNLELLDEYEQPILLKGSCGMYASGEYETIMHLGCDCGHEFNIKKRDFPGRRSMRSCGRPECTCSEVGSKASKDKSKPEPKQVDLSKLGRPRVYGKECRTQTVYLPDDLRERLKKAAERKKVSVSRALAEYAYLGLAAEVSSQDGGQNAGSTE